MEIVSICCNQNVNSVNVELKQWLYDHGNECKHNTGGWIKCKNTGSVKQYNAYNTYSGQTVYTAAGVHTEKSELLNDKIKLTGSASAKATSYSDRNSWYGRSDVWAHVNVGTVSTLPLPMDKYSQCIITSTNPVTVNIRSGPVNNASTDIATATIIASGVSPLNIESGDTFASIVIGKSIGSTGRGFSTASIGDYTQSYTAEITEIYLI